MPIVVTELMDGLTAIDDRGSDAGFTKRFHVTGATGTDHELIYNALADSAVPAINDELSGHTNLVCQRRSARVIPNSSNSVEVVCEYVPKHEAGIDFVFSGESSIAETEVTRDRFGFSLYVQHTFTTDQSAGELAGLTITQGSSPSVFKALTTLRATGKLQRDLPQVETAQWVGHTNSAAWASGPSRTWLCTRADFVPLDLSTSPKTYLFTFEFQHDPQGVNPLIYFVDPRDNKPPPDLIDGVGIKIPAVYPERDFNEQFPI